MIRSTVNRLVPRSVQSAGSLLTATTVNRATSFIVYAAVARATGVVAFGHLALGISIFMMFFRFTSWGLRPVVTRTLARPDPDPRFFGRCVALVLVASALGYVALEAFLAVIGYSSAADAVIRILFVGIPVYSIGNLAESVFLTKDETGFVPAISAPVWIVQTGVAIWLVTLAGRGVESVAWSIVAAYATMTLLYLVVMRRRYGIRLFVWDPLGVVRLAKETSSFLGISVLNGITSSAAMLVVSGVVSETDVGLFAAAHQLLVPVNMVSQAATEAMYPRLVGRYNRSVELGKRVLSLGVEGILLLVLPAAVGLFVLARPLLHLVYGGEGFDLSATMLRILAFTLVANGLSQTLGKMLWAADKERTSLWIAVTRVALSMSLTFFLVVRFGVVGAAWAGLAVATFNALQHYVPVRMAVGPVRLIRRFLRPLLASVVMAAALSATHFGAFGSVAIGIVVFAGAVGVIYKLSPGEMVRGLPGAVASQSTGGGGST